MTIYNLQWTIANEDEVRKNPQNTITMEAAAMAAEGSFFMGDTIKRVVVKIGTSTLTHDSGRPHLRRLDRLARTITDLQNRGLELVLVSSGAIAVGAMELDLTERPKSLRGKQAAAAVGQCRLMYIYDKLFSEYGQKVAQILLTGSDLRVPERRGPLLNTFEELMSWRVVPIVNENDSVGHEEIEWGQGAVFGDNDSLSAAVAALIDADLLVLLTDRDGLYTGDPRHDPTATRIERVTELTDDLRASACGAGTARGTGGMVTKLNAAAIALERGMDMVVANGADPCVLYEILDGKSVGTLFRC